MLKIEKTIIVGGSEQFATFTVLNHLNARAAIAHIKAIANRYESDKLIDSRARISADGTTMTVTDAEGEKHMYTVVSDDTGSMSCE